jgi:hypothetical protein
VRLVLRLDQDRYPAIHHRQELERVAELTEIHFPMPHRFSALKEVMLVDARGNASPFFQDTPDDAGGTRQVYPLLTQQRVMLQVIRPYRSHVP